MEYNIKKWFESNKFLLGVIAGILIMICIYLFLCFTGVYLTCP